MSITFPPAALDRARPIEVLILDVDGVLTDGRLYYGPDGELMKVFNAQDGHAIKSLIRNGVEVALISGRDSSMVRQRASELGIRHYWLGVDDKTVALEALIKATAIGPDRMAHMGDDQPDLGLFDRVHLRLAPANAHPEVHARADYVTSAEGGHGAVREACALLNAARR